jgi:hypothetical protein
MSLAFAVTFNPAARQMLTILQYPGQHQQVFLEMLKWSFRGAGWRPWVKSTVPVGHMFSRFSTTICSAHDVSGETAVLNLQNRSALNIRSALDVFLFTLEDTISQSCLVYPT